MGCHTWCYNKVERSIEDARKIYLDNQDETIKNWEYYCENPDCDVRKAYTEWTQERCEFWLSVFKRQKRMVEKGLCNVAVMNHQPDSIYIPDKGLYIEVGDFHDPFRIGVTQVINYFHIKNVYRIFLNMKKKKIVRSIFGMKGNP